MSPTPDIRTLLERARTDLASRSDAPLLDAQVLLAHTLGRELSWLYAHPEYHPDTAQCNDFDNLVARRRDGEPVAHLTGRREFWSLPLAVDASTLVPRPETEHLVEAVLALELPNDAKVLDLGCGSGAIALALACERPMWMVTATDRSTMALNLARRNAETLDLAHIRFIAGCWYEPLPPDERFDLIVSNPPYIAATDPHLEQSDLRFEPRSALVSGEDGLDDIRIIIDGASAHLAPDGWLWLEHGYDQGEQVAELLQRAGYDCTSYRRDLAGHVRCTGGRGPDLSDV